MKTPSELELSEIIRRQAEEAVADNIYAHTYIREGFVWGCKLPMELLVESLPYVKHKGSCKFRPSWAPEGRPPCTCGLDAILKRVNSLVK